MLYFPTVVYTAAKQPVEPICLNRLYGNLGYLLYSYIWQSWLYVFHNFSILICDLFNFMTTEAFFLPIHYLTVFA